MKLRLARFCLQHSRTLCSNLVQSVIPWLQEHGSRATMFLQSVAIQHRPQQVEEKWYSRSSNEDRWKPELTTTTTIMTSNITRRQYHKSFVMVGWWTSYSSLISFHLNSLESQTSRSCFHFNKFQFPVRCVSVSPKTNKEHHTITVTPPISLPLFFSPPSLDWTLRLYVHVCLCIFVVVLCYFTCSVNLTKKSFLVDGWCWVTTLKCIKTDVRAAVDD